MAKIRVEPRGRAHTILNSPSATLISHSFEPDAGRAAFLDQHVRERLADSLSYVFAEAGQHLAVEPGDLTSFVARLRRAPVSPLAYSLYCDLVLAIERDELDQASAFFREIVALDEEDGQLRVFILPDPTVDPIAARYARFVDTDPEMPFEVFAPSQAAAAASEANIHAALSLLGDANPEMALEFRALIRHIILAAGSKDPKALTFDGASSFMLWGAIIINADRKDGPLGMTQMLAHESAHNLLFGYGVDGPLLENDATERYVSPLRPDARPIEGIYHATFVVARMRMAVASLLDADILPPADIEQALSDLASHDRSFASGIETVRRHATLTALGEEVIAPAESYMASTGGAVSR